VSETDRPSDGSNRILLRTWDDGEAAIVQQLLAGYGIPCQVVSDVPHAILPIYVDGLGEIRILVPTARLAEARSLLAEHRRQGFRVIRGGKRSRRDDGEKVAGRGG
jgi:hypothetical protein